MRKAGLAAVVVLAFLLTSAGASFAQTGPTISINDVTVQEGDRGTNNARFTVSLSAASSQTVTVQYSTANDSATAGMDYTSATSRTLTFEPQDRTESFTIEILADTIDEQNEKFFVNLTNPTNATIGDGQGVGTITDDDAGGASPAASASPSPSPSRSPSPSPSPSRSPSPSPSPTRSAAASPTPSPSLPVAFGSPTAAAPSPVPAPTPPATAITGSSEATAAMALALLMLVIGWMLRRRFGEEHQL